ncbi:MAG: hypothetical protein IPH28_17455 [Cytophagaceae bacterium]|nr:hypothetical protein [Cytophagaceae bacterium]MBK9509497.1 hypothetical protein [Cytophagaceae bacterium]MBK9936068.1 hypothetical protein [Cytophagaceae bacterium]MBL0304042.1 hypothetical protein [Cytophagaceae bacterium]MBL0326853.1 hypothetical protein [Cytophagaceae bacterium]
MKFIKKIPNDYCIAELYFFNNKFVIKFEIGTLEQIYKVSELDVSGEEEIEEMLGETFLKKVMKRFEQMQEDFDEILDSAD